MVLRKWRYLFFLLLLLLLAAAGGVSTLVDMPLNSIPVTTTLQAFRTKLASTTNKLWIDVAFWGGVVPGNEEELVSMLQEGTNRQVHAIASN